MKGQLCALLRSFFYAQKGIGYGIKTQRNLRIHLTALTVVIVFNAMAGLSVTHWCIELLCCMLVISMELVNTALESACDQISREIHPLLGHAKDAAAGAVLISAIGSVVIACLIFFRGGEYQQRVAALLQMHGWIKYALLIGVIAAALFVFLPSYMQNKREHKEFL